MTQALAAWHEFYGVLGGAAATLTGLLFVAASVGAGVFSRDRRGAVRMFLSASVVQFGCILAVSLSVLAPVDHWSWPGAVAAATGLFGLAYSAAAWRTAMRDGLFAKLDLDDWLWYAFGPVAGYASIAAAGALLIAGWAPGVLSLASAVCALLVIAIHNAWDITVWTITRQRD